MRTVVTSKHISSRHAREGEPLPFARRVLIASLVVASVLLVLLLFGSSGRFFRKRAQDARGAFVEPDARFRRVNRLEILCQAWASDISKGLFRSYNATRSS